MLLKGKTFIILFCTIRHFTYFLGYKKTIDLLVEAIIQADNITVYILVKTYSYIQYRNVIKCFYCVRFELAKENSCIISIC